MNIYRVTNDREREIGTNGWNRRKYDKTFAIMEFILASSSGILTWYLVSVQEYKTILDSSDFDILIDQSTDENTKNK